MAAYGDGDGGTGFEDAAAFDGVDDVWQSAVWNQNVAGEAPLPLMPFWVQEGEAPEHQSTIFSFHSEQCSDFRNGYCALHRSKGRAQNPCYGYHFESQRRRSPIDPELGQLLYWDVQCQNDAQSCPSGSACIFAHNTAELSYHPAKYKTRRCNGRGCRGEAICCFAHSEAELRVWAPSRYSYWALAASAVDARGPTHDELAIVAAAAAQADEWPLGQAAGAAVGEEWQRPLFPAHLPASRHKQRFCASYPDVSQCRRGAACAFAHTREEARTPLLSEEQEQQAPGALTEDFFMYNFKTLWCPIGVQHDWQTCVYAHNYQDARRQVSIGYGPKPCPYWAKKDPNAEYSQRCPLGLRCPHAHGAKEQLYHPQYFRTVICRDLRAKCCPRQKLCAFFHRRQERRKCPADNTDYNSPLKEEALPAEWVADFLMPPFRDAAPQDSAENPDETLQMDLGQLDEGDPTLLGRSEDVAGHFWCGGYWDPQGNCPDDLLNMGQFAGMCLPSDEQSSAHPGAARLPLPSSVKIFDGDADGSPRTPSRGSESSTSAGGELLGSSERLVNSEPKSCRRSARAIGAAGVVGGAGGSAGGSSSASSSPWMIPSNKEPSWGPFGGPFDGYPGLLMGAGLTNSSPIWDPSEPAIVS